MDRFEAILGKKKKPPPVVEAPPIVTSSSVSRRRTYAPPVDHGEYIESEGPRSQLFHIRGPSGLTITIPMRKLSCSAANIPDQYERSSLTINLPTNVVRRLLNENGRLPEHLRTPSMTAEDGPDELA